MNILHRVTQRLLRKNPTRTWVTIIGIMLSMALFVAVLEGAYSGLMFLLNIEGTTDGYYQAYYYGLDEAQAKQAANQRAVKSSTAWQCIAYSKPLCFICFYRLACAVKILYRRNKRISDFFKRPFPNSFIKWILVRIL